jgi:hypothetical protein
MKVLKIIGVLLLIVIAGAAIFIMTYQPKKYSDFGVYADLRSQVLTVLKEYKATERPITQDFKDFTLNLSFPFNKVFGNDNVGIPLASFETDRISVVTISQFEVPPKSGYCRDFTLNIRPRYEYKAPIFHIDFMKPSPGVPGLCTVDFFDVDKENINLEKFFGSQIGEVKKALSMVEKYQRTAEDGRGKITKYLDPWKSLFRVELKEPPTQDETVRKEYFATAQAAIKLLLTAYLKSLYNLQPDPGYAKQHEEKTKELVLALYKNDVAISLGRRIFKDQFNKYWLDGFWNVQVELKNEK